MSLQNYLEKMKKIQTVLLEFIEKEDNLEENYQNFINLLDEYKILDNHHQAQAILHLIVNIANNHNRSVTFFSKIEKVILYFKDQIKQTLSNRSIFNIFKSNKKILLFLIEQELFVIDQSIATIMQEDIYQEAKYQQYFFTELKPYLEKREIESISREIPENFEEFRKNGENHSELCELIRKDSIEDFITYVNKTNLLLKKTVDHSIFETNPLLLKSIYPSNDNYYYGQKKENTSRLTLIEYAAFFGSIQIFKYLNENGCALEPSLWIYAIHGQDPEIIQILKDKNISPLNNSYKEVLIESIKCHHIEMTNYIQNNFADSKTVNVSMKSIKYYNFAFIKNDEVDDSKFYTFCKYDHCPIVDILIKEADIDAGALIISINLLESNFFLYILFNKITLNIFKLHFKSFRLNTIFFSINFK